MKTITKGAIVTALLILSFTAQAQVKFNPKVGMNVSRLNSDPSTPLDSINTSARLGWQMGMDLRIGRRVYLQTGAHYQQAGSMLVKYRENNVVQLLRDNLRVHYLNVPVSVGVNIVDRCYFKLRANAGPQLKTVLVVDDNIIGLNENDFERAAFSMNLGVGVDIWKITLDANYDIGLTPLMEGSPNSRNHAFSLTAGLVF